MNLKNHLLRNTLRGVKKSPGRFIAIMAIILISCAFYSGVKAAAPDLKRSAWSYYDEYCLADIQIVSTLGFNDDDLSELLANEHFDGGYCGYSADLLTKSVSGMAAVKVMSWDEDQPLNKLYITDGRLPEKSDECVVDADAMELLGIAVGDAISFETGNDDDISDILADNTFKVVGTAMSPLYVTNERGKTTIGTGTLSAFAYILEDAFAYDTYTDIYLSASGTKDAEPFSEEYMEIVSAAEYAAEAMADGCLEKRRASITDGINEELDKAEKELEEGEQKYNDGYAEYQTALNEYNNAFKEISDGRTELAESEKEYNEALEAIAEKETALEEISATVPQIEEVLSKYEKKYEKVLPDELLEEFKLIQDIYERNGIDADISNMLAVYVITDPKKDSASKTAAGTFLSSANDQISTTIDAALQEIEQQKAVLEASGKELEKAKEELDVHEAELKNAKHELDNASKELKESRTEIDDAKQELLDAKAEAEEMVSDRKWYVWNRDELDPDCFTYGEDADRIDSIAAVFPVFFILIAALVCCTTMSRMVEEERTETGTLKALGFSSGRIIAQYVLYAAAASVIGSVIGNAIGFALLPTVIFECYKSMYNYPFFEAPFMLREALIYMAVALLCTTLSAAFTASSELKNVPAQLIRPKPPRSGKRILLERIGFIWKRMKFNSKVTFRNLVRYKRRFFMMLIGIGGCTALLLTAFGLKQAISCIAGKQYDEITIYSAMAVLEDDVTDEQMDGIKAVIADNQDILLSGTEAIQKTANISNSSDEAEGILFVPSDKDSFGDYVALRERKSQDPLKLYDSGVVITEKLAKLLGVKAGDMIQLEGSSQEIMVTGIAENYTYHYVYMTKALYEECYGTYEPNTLLLDTDGLPESTVRSELTEKLVACEGIITASFMYDETGTFRDLVSSLDTIVAVVIIFSAALSFVILFNLANININERIRELATIKVLGFFDGEVGAYIYRENTISSLIGMLAGLGSGILLERFVISYAEVDEVMFSPDIPLYCFGMAALMIVIFIVAVNILLYFKLKRIDMASSMKAIE